MRKKNLCRLILSVEMLAQSVALEIDASSVEPVTTHSTAIAYESQSSPLTGDHILCHRLADIREHE